jgi:hypothetical protein
VSRAVGGLEGFSTPTNSPTERAINTGVGAFFGGLGRGASTTALDRLAGTAAGMMMGHGAGGWLGAYLGGRLGGSVGHEAHEAVSAFLKKFPPSVVARAVTSLGEPYVRILAQQYNDLTRPPPSGGDNAQGSGPP